MSKSKQYTSIEAAEYLGIRLDKLRKMAQSGEIPSTQIGLRGPRLYKISDLDNIRLTLEVNRCK